jgi:ribokinase
MVNITVVGSVNMDLIIALERLPLAGETLLGSRTTYALGGKGANQAVAAARLGASSVLIGKVGDDAFGAQIRHNLAREGIDLTYLGEATGVPTGVAVIMLVHGENTIVVARGANDMVTPEDVQHAQSAIARSDAVLCQLEVPLTAVEAALAAGRAAGVTTILDPAPAQRCPETILALADYITPNRHEARSLTGIAIEDYDDARRAAHHLLHYVRKGVVVKLGGAGALVVEAGEEHRIEGIAVEVVDTTAAGDAFCAALGVALAHGVAFPEAARFANAVGALTVTRLGAQPSLPTLAEVQRFAEARRLTLPLPGIGEWMMRGPK